MKRAGLPAKGTRSASQRVASTAWIVTALLGILLVPVLLPSLPHRGVPFCATDATATHMMRAVTLARLLGQAQRYDEERLYLLEEELEIPRENGISIKGDHRVSYDDSWWWAFMMMALDRGDHESAAKEAYDHYLGETLRYFRTRCQGPAFGYQEVNVAAFRLPAHLKYPEYLKTLDDPTKPAYAR